LPIEESRRQTKLLFSRPFDAGGVDEVGLK
jgi:hypothetical protein